MEFLYLNSPFVLAFLFSILSLQHMTTMVVFIVSVGSKSISQMRIWFNSMYKTNGQNRFCLVVILRFQVVIYEKETLWQDTVCNVCCYTPSVTKSHFEVLCSCPFVRDWRWRVNGLVCKTLNCANEKVEQDNAVDHRPLSRNTVFNGYWIQSNRYNRNAKYIFHGAVEILGHHIE